MNLITDLKHSTNLKCNKTREKKKQPTDIRHCPPPRFMIAILEFSHKRFRFLRKTQE